MIQAVNGETTKKARAPRAKKEATTMGVERELGELRGDVKGLLSRQQNTDASIIELFNQNHVMLQSFHQGQLDAQKDREALGKTLGEMITEGARRQEERHDQLAQQLATQKGSFGMFRWIVDSVILLCGAAMTEVVTRFFR